MKKTLVLLLAVAFAVPAFAGNIFSNVETYGEIETIGYNTNGAALDDVRDAGQKSVHNQTLFGMSADLVEDVRANVTFAYLNAWEGVGDPISDETSPMGGYLQKIRVTEANVVVSNVFGALELKLGRQYYGNEDSPVMYIGPRHNWYSNINEFAFYSFDGALATWSNDSLAVSAFYAQLEDESDVRMTGLTFDYAINNNLTAGAYWYDMSDVDHDGIWGGKVAYQNEGSKLAVEYAKNYEGHVFGHNNEGWMLKVDGALNLDMEKVALTPRITYYHEEKGFEAMGNYTAGIVIGNIAGAFSLYTDASDDPVDFRVFNAGIDLGIKALEKVTFSFDYVNLKANNSWVGNEFDLTAKYQHNDYVTFTLGGGLMTNIADYSGDVYGAQVGMLIKF